MEIESKATSIRGLGNVLNMKETTDYTCIDGVVSLTEDKYQDYNVFKLEEDNE